MSAEYMREKRAKDEAFRQRGLAMNRTARAAERELAKRHPEELEQIKREIRIAEGIISEDEDLL